MESPCEWGINIKLWCWIHFCFQNLDIKDMLRGVMWSLRPSFSTIVLAIPCPINNHLSRLHLWWPFNICTKPIVYLVCYLTEGADLLNFVVPTVSNNTTVLILWLICSIFVLNCCIIPFIIWLLRWNYYLVSYLFILVSCWFRYKAWGSLLGRQLAERDIIVACLDYR